MAEPRTATIAQAPGSEEIAATRSRDYLDSPAQRTRPRKPVGYSRFVIFMKFLLPAAALCLVAAIVIWPQINITDNRFSIGFSKIQVSAKENPSMVNARFVGADKKNQPFSVTADLAKNLALGASEIELEMPKADIGVRDGSWLVLTANTGLYNQKDKILDLDGAVNLFHDSGFEFTTETAKVDLNAGVAEGGKATQGQGPFGQLTAEGFRIEEKGNRILFTGKSKLILHPESLKEQK
jgi:lipopolysaccharide export system protein LptC